MGALLLWLLVQTGLLQGSGYVYGYGYVDWADSENARGEAEAPQRPTMRATVAHRLEEDVPKVVAAFLHTGDSSALAQANCSRRYELGGLRASSSSTSRHSLRPAVEAVVRAAGLLNGLLPLGDGQPQRDAVWYGALVRSLLDSDLRIHRAALALQAKPRLLLQATRSGGHVAVRDLKESEWHDEFRERKRVHGPRGQGPEPGEIKWSAPYLECEGGSFVPYWLLTLSSGIYAPGTDAAAPDFRGVVRVDVNLQDEDIDQCSSSGWFAGTHRCNLTTMECKPVPGHGFVLDKYKCQCKRGFYSPSRVALNGVSKSEQGLYSDEPSDVSPRCLPCREGCSFCRDDSPCLAQEDGVLRVAVASFQGLCMLLDFISMPVVYHFRRNKRIKASGLILLEAIVAGAVLLYFPVMILYFQPSVFRCILLRWVRLLGFATVYGTVILKLYRLFWFLSRVLKVFLSRTAQRIPYMTSWRVLRLLAAILLVVLWFLVAWTLAMCQSTDIHHALVDMGVTPEGLHFNMCLLDRWDYMMAVAVIEGEKAVPMSRTLRAASDSCLRATEEDICLERGQGKHERCEGCARLPNSNSRALPPVSQLGRWNQNMKHSLAALLWIVLPPSYAADVFHMVLIVRGLDSDDDHEKVPRATKQHSLSEHSLANSPKLTRENMGKIPKSHSLRRLL
ncbi:hypothetical protein MHYP_G00001280 [Metynnis hypsauchen]